MIQLKNLEPTVHIVSMMIAVCRFIINGGDGCEFVASAVDVDDDLIKNVNEYGSTVNSSSSVRALGAVVVGDWRRGTASRK